MWGNEIRERERRRKGRKEKYDTAEVRKGKVR